MEPPRDVAGQISVLGAGFLRSEPVAICCQALRTQNSLAFDPVSEAINLLFIAIQAELRRPQTFARRQRCGWALRLALTAGRHQAMSEGELKTRLMRAADDQPLQMTCIGTVDDRGCGAVFEPSISSFRLAYYCRPCSDRTGVSGQRRRDRSTMQVARANGRLLIPVWGTTFDKNDQPVEDKRIWLRKCESCATPMTVIYTSVDLCARCGGSGTPTDDHTTDTSIRPFAKCPDTAVPKTA